MQGGGYGERLDDGGDGRVGMVQQMSALVIRVHGKVMRPDVAVDEPRDMSVVFDFVGVLRRRKRDGADERSEHDGTCASGRHAAGILFRIPSIRY